MHKQNVTPMESMPRLPIVPRSIVSEDKDQTVEENESDNEENAITECGTQREADGVLNEHEESQSNKCSAQLFRNSEERMTNNT